MLEQAIENIIRKQRPYYLLQGNPIKGIDNQYWLVFKHRDADNLLHNFITFALENHILHEGSDNFTVAAHSKNAESVTFFYSWESLDSEEINNSIRQFDAEWQREDITFDISTQKVVKLI